MLLSTLHLRPLKHSFFFIAFFLFSMGTCFVHAQSLDPPSARPTSTEEGASIPARIRALKEDKTWMVPLLSAQYCAYAKAYQVTLRQNQILMRRGVMSLEDAEDEIREYRKGLAQVKKGLQHFGRKSWSCQHRAIKRLLHCLPSVERIGIGSIGVPYGGSWCEKEPYLTYVELETGKEDPIRHQEPPIEMNELVKQVEQGFFKEGIKAKVTGVQVKKDRELRVVLPAGMEGETKQIIDGITVTYGDLLKRARCYYITVVAEGSLEGESYYFKKF